jgi:hypothetical protein
MNIFIIYEKWIIIFFLHIYKKIILININYKIFPKLIKMEYGFLLQSLYGYF